MNLSSAEPSASPSSEASHASAPPPGARGGLARIGRELWWLALLGLLWSVGLALFFRLLPLDVVTEATERVLLAGDVLAIALGVASVVVVGRLARAARGSSPPSLLRAAVALVAIQLGLDVLANAARIAFPNVLAGAFEYALPLAQVVVDVAARAALWLAVARLLPERVPRWLTASYLLAVGVVLAATLPRFVLARSFLYETAEGMSLFGKLSLGRLAASTLARVATLWLFALLAKSALASAAGAARSIAAPGAPSPQRDLAVGAVWLSAGVLVSVASFSMASGEGGGRYLVTTGAIAYGAVRVVRGLRRA